MGNSMSLINRRSQYAPRRRAHCIIGSVATIIALTAVAQTAAAVPAKLKRECRSDYKSFCPSYKIGTSRMRSCMRSNGRQLSWGCYQALKDHGYVKRR